MGVPSILALFLISHQLLLHSAGENNVCPDSYDCGNHGQVGFPHSNNKYRHCGFFTVNCSGSVAELNLGVEGLWYEVGGKFLYDSVYVNDLRLGDLIDKNSCDVFGNYLDWTLIDNPSISFIMPPSLTLFKCTTISPKLDKQQDDYFHGNDSYRDCAGYTVYYTFPPNYNLVSTVGDFPPNCSVIQLPVVSEIENRNASDLFSVLSSEFSIRFHVRKACRECRQKGGQCAHDTPEFHCIKMEEAGRRKLSLLLGTAAAGIGILVIILFCIIKKLALSKSVAFWKHKTESDRKIEAFLKSCGSLSPERYTYSDVKKMTNSFRIKLGQGGYGCVFKGKLENGCFVAVKVLKGLKGNGEEFINEVATISRTSHVNIVTLLGFCFDGCHRALIYEFVPNGSLDKFIHDGDSSTYRHLGWEALYRIAVGIARGLEYLHRGCTTRILHFDIKPHNILLNEDFCPKISDFGLAKLCPQKESIISLMVARGTVGYIAPEVFNRNFGGVSHKSDVYSYGMMILEMVGGRKNVSVEVDHTSEIYFPHWVYKRLELDEELGLHSIMNDETNDNVKKMIIVGLWCIQTYPCNRPSMSRVLDMLEGSTESLEIPPKPFLTSPSRPPVDSSTTLVL